MGALAGGWLTLFCVLLCIVSPFLNTMFAVYEYITCSRFIGATPNAITFLFAGIGVLAAITLFGVIVGIQLWNTSPRAVEWAKTHLVLSVILQLLMLAVPGKLHLPERL